MILDDSLSNRDEESIRASHAAREKGYINFVTLDIAFQLIENYCGDKPPISSLDESLDWLSEPSATNLPAQHEELPDFLISAYPDKEADYIELNIEKNNETPDWLSSNTEADDTEWYIGMSDDFIKSIERIDKKLMGRILEAMTHICKTPITPQGDTIKPLSSEMKGLWRYRIGDFRLVYQPETSKKRVTLLLFDSRGTVYQ